MKNKIITTIKLVFILSLFLIVVYCIIVVHWACTTKVEMVGKTYYEFVVNSGEIVDYHDFLKPEGDSHLLESIDEDTRLELAEYMKLHNLRLAEGSHYFNRVSPTFDKLLKEFKFVLNN